MKNEHNQPVNDAEKTAKKGIFLGCSFMLLFLALIVAAGIWAVSTLVGAFSNDPVPEYRAEESIVSPRPIDEKTERETDFDLSETLGLTAGEFFDAYNAAVPAWYQLDVESEYCEISRNGGNCTYEFFLPDTGLGEYVSVFVECEGRKPSLDQPVVSLFVSDCFDAKGSADIPAAVSAALGTLQDGEEAQKMLFETLSEPAVRYGADVDFQAGNIALYFSLYEQGDYVRLPLSIFPAY